MFGNGHPVESAEVTPAVLRKREIKNKRRSSEISLVGCLRSIVNNFELIFLQYPAIALAIVSVIADIIEVSDNKPMCVCARAYNLTNTQLSDSYLVQFVRVLRIKWQAPQKTAICFMVLLFRHQFTSRVLNSGTQTTE